MNEKRGILLQFKLSAVSYKRFFLGLLFFCLAVQAGRLAFGYLLDPVGIWGTPLVRGFNHFKVKQRKYLYVCKPYEYIREKPDILYIGGSQVYIGFSPHCLNEPTKKVYTMGLPSLSLPKMREYLRFVYKIHKPEIIYMGIAPENFSERSYHSHIPDYNYSEERLRKLTGASWGAWWQRVEDTMGIPIEFWSMTVRESRAHKKEEPILMHGWDAQRGNWGKVYPRDYYWFIWLIVETYEGYKYESEAMECFRDILREAKEAEVPLVVFFTPMSVDRHAMINLLGYRPEYQRIKREVAKVVPVLDFAFASELSTNREAYFYDAGHFRASLGEKLKPILEGRANPEPYGYFLTPESVDAAFAAEDAAWETWKSENAEYVQALTECIESGRKPKVGDFAKYIGF